jgi:VWFA-related protein
MFSSKYWNNQVCSGPSPTRDRRFAINRFASELFLFAICACSALGQVAAPSPTPPPADETDVVKITTALIQLDATITDKRGKIVTDLGPDEVEIYENGKKQNITNFSFISNAQAAEQRAIEKNEKIPVVLPPSTVKPGQVRRTIALIVDDLNLSFDSIHFVRGALKKFVDEQMGEGDLVAVIRTGAGIGALQQFTTDKRQLYAAIERVRWNGIGTGNIAAIKPMEEKPPQLLGEKSQPGVRTPEGLQKEFESFRESVFATGTLGAMDYVVRGMSELPGRKSILLLSEGFKLYQEDALGFKEGGRVLNAIKKLVDSANRASVVIYTMDARGMTYTGLTAADDTSGRGPEQVQKELADRALRLIDTQAGLKTLAEETGGLAITNTNDLSNGIRRILDDQSYYLLAYVPDDATFDPAKRPFNRIEIKVTRPGLNVRYRNGFFGVAEGEAAKTAATPQQRILDALTSPFGANQIPVRLNTLFGANTIGSFARALMHVQAQNLEFEELPDGSRRTTFDILGVAFGDNGTVADQSSRTYTLTVKKDGYKHLLENGFVYDLTIPVKKPGAYQLRVAIRDHRSDKLGSANQFIDIPNLKKERLLLSGAVLENVSPAEWQRRNSGQPAGESDPLTDTSLRQFKRGTVLNYGFAIYNAKQESTGANLSSQTRIFRDGMLVFEGKIQPVVSPPSADRKASEYSSALTLGTEMLPGDYVLQVTITDNLAKTKQNTARQLVQFEIVE